MTAARVWDQDIIGTRPVATHSDLPLFAVPARTEAEVAREDAIERAYEHADDRWRQVAYAALVACARRYPEFTADSVWDELRGTVTDTHNPSALGPLFRVARSRGLIEKTARTVFTKLPQRHREVTIWKSLVCDVRVGA